MTDRIYPSAKSASTMAQPQQNGTSINGTSFPAPKSQQYRPVYRPRPPSPRRSQRSFCCRCFCWTFFFIVLIILIVAAAAAVVYAIYRPQRPSFSVTSLRLSTFNLTSKNLNSKLDLSISTRNSNKKISFIYDPVLVSATSSGVSIATGQFPPFSHSPKNTTSLKTTLTSNSQTLDQPSVDTLRSNAKNKLPLEILLDTKVKVKTGGLKTNKISIRVFCKGIQLALPKGNSSSVSTDSVNCSAKLRMKIWKWRIG